MGTSDPSVPAGCEMLTLPTTAGWWSHDGSWGTAVMAQNHVGFLICPTVLLTCACYRSNMADTGDFTQSLQQYHTEYYPGRSQNLAYTIQLGLIDYFESWLEPSPSSCAANVHPPPSRPQS